MIKHVSFDVWGTLISANPEYAKARTDLIAQAFTIDPAFVKTTYTKTKRIIDSMAETTGEALTTRECFDLLYENLEEGPFARGLALEDNLHALFLEHAPSVLDETKYQVSTLRSKGITCSIGSNSNFIPGSVMYPFLQREFDDAFSYGVFSDELRVAKPDAVFFTRVAHKLMEVKKLEDLEHSSILHVGDNYICDGVGPRAAGMKYVILNDVSDIQPAFRHLATMFN